MKLPWPINKLDTQERLCFLIGKLACPINSTGSIGSPSPASVLPKIRISAQSWRRL